MAFPNPFVGWHSDAPLVRPYVRLHRPEPIPDGALAPTLAGSCDGCSAAPLVVFWLASVNRRGHTVWWELKLCGHHATEHEDSAEGQGWAVALDRRQRLVDEEATR